MITQYLQESWLLPLVVLVSLWEMIWKVIAMWKAGRNNHLVWFIILVLINTAGILPIIYILINRKKPMEHFESGNDIETVVIEP